MATTRGDTTGEDIDSVLIHRGFRLSGGCLLREVQGLDGLVVLRALLGDREVLLVGVELLEVLLPLVGLPLDAPFALHGPGLLPPLDRHFPTGLDKRWVVLTFS